MCRFGTPWAPSEAIRIVIVEDVDKSKIASSKNILKKVLLQVMKIDDLSTFTLPEISGMCSFSIDDYGNAVTNNQKRFNIIYKRKPCRDQYSSV